MGLASGQVPLRDGAVGRSGVVSLTGWVRVETWGMASVTARASAVEQAKLPPGLWCSMES